MGDLSFSVLDARPRPNSAVPTLAFRVRIADSSVAPIHSILLRCQVQIQPRRRPHAPAEQDRLLDMFGTPDRWNETLRPFQWTQTTLIVPAFEGQAEMEMPVPCTYDFDVVAAKYLSALDGGEVPLLLLFSGVVFARHGDGFQVHHIPWDKEAAFRMPVRVWRELMDSYFGESAWIRLRRENMDRLRRFMAERALHSWDDAIDALVREAAEAVS
jgi:hypothetical protein